MLDPRPRVARNALTCDCYVTPAGLIFASDWNLGLNVLDVSARRQIWATHSGNFAGVTPDRRRITFDGMVLYRMEDGLIAET